MPKKSQRRTVNKDAWLATYGDMITLVLTFFILLYSMSSISAEKWDIILEAFSTRFAPRQVVIDVMEEEGEDLSGFPGSKPGIEQSEIDEMLEEISNMDQLYEAMKEYIETEGLQDSIEIGKNDGYVIMRFQSNVFFAPDSATLLPLGQSLLDELVVGMTPLEQDIQLLRVDGHTATVPNQAQYTISDRLLSSSRANSVLMYIEEKNIINPQKMLTVGYGKYHPIASNDTQQGREENRRVEIFITDRTDTMIDMNDVYKAFENTDDDQIQAMDDVVDNIEADGFEIFENPTDGGIEIFGDTEGS